MDLSKFSETRIAVVGDVMVDRYWWGSVNRISPEAPVPIVKLERETFKPGGAANVAVNAASLGAKVNLIGVVGNDPEAKILSASLSEHGIGYEGLVKVAKRPTIVKTRVLAHGQQVIRLDNENVSEIDHVSCERLVERITDLLKRQDVDVLIISDYGKGLLTQSVVTELIATSNTQGIPVLADPKGKHFEKYSRASVLTPNRREAAEACKLEDSLFDLVERAGQQLLRELELGNVLITESENGMTLFPKKGESVHFDASAHEVYDVTGAGDTVIACLGVAIAAGLPMIDAASLANFAAGISVQQIGTTAIPVSELQKLLEL
jgi:D-beta-D-heptose 7-phosphate kinase / D-beta-D-heptose 1-phosphate adenosyltransferase